MERAWGLVKVFPLGVVYPFLFDQSAMSGKVIPFLDSVTGIQICIESRARFEEVMATWQSD